MKIIVVGGGETGKIVTNMLIAEKHKVSLVENDEVLSKDLANNSDALIIKGDGTELQILKDAGLENADAIIAVTNDDKTNLMVCEIAKSKQLKKIIARVNVPTNEELFTKLGVTSVIPIVGMTVTAIKKELFSDGERLLAQIGEGDTQVVEITVTEKSKLVGKTPSLKSAVIGAIYRDGEILMPKKSLKLKEGDVLIVVVKTKNLQDVKKQIIGS